MLEALENYMIMLKVMCGLENLGVSYEQFGWLLIPIILEKLPKMIKLQISRKLGSGNWNVQDFLECINEEILVRENCEYLKQHNFEDSKPANTFFTSSKVKCSIFLRRTIIIVISVQNYNRC